jgi:urease beta subunit
MAVTDRIELAPGRERIRLTVTNTSRHLVRVSSHYPFWRTNARLVFDRDRARGFRLDLPSGSTLPFAAGDTRVVTLVRYAGRGDDNGRASG